MASTKYTYNKSCDAQRLTLEIQESTIIIALDYITGSADLVDIWFKAELAAGEVTTLTALVGAHVNTPLPDNQISMVEVSKLPPAQPFADPLYRTKHQVKTGITTIANNSSSTIDFVLSEELYASGGTVVIKNAKYGDWLSAEIRDTLGVIPEAYRSALCENWPTVATYIISQYLEVYDSNSVWFKQGVDTRPLVARISAGLALRVTYNACDDASGDTRSVLVNYFLNKKL